MLARHSINQAIKAEAHRLGFILAGITFAERPPHYAAYESWLEKGRQAEMGYLATGRARQARADPHLVFPPGRAVLVLGLPYPIPGPLPDLAGRSPVGRVASYAWGQDYHFVIPPRLKALGDFIIASFGADAISLGFTDSAPILERDLAQRAGLGWIGKNTCLINPAHGSCFLLAELFINLNLEIDPPFLPDRCGTCTRCIQACPTGCILPDRTLDAGRCISYLTIEKKGPIDRELRPLIGNWVFGCDVCQIVCPWNIKFAALKGYPSFDPCPNVPFPDLIQELNLPLEGFNRKFLRNPVQRPHRRGYLRNVAIALGNSHDPAALPALLKNLSNEPEPLVRGAAAWAIRQIGEKAALRALNKVARLETNAYVLEELAG
jgi:epoxyqueuosine reductase